ncbi:ferric uptake regulation protein Fur [Liquorilactobacillus sucicola DSM 21376 = JCM 15457]|uniref:Ferric uptake regulation protein n=1 Tax=Liquorilactobacillus sucicola DSM 21376 = JCM 15457 TaxID=1423806 RepID=A0A023CV42_9LACO|nr:Fur family transcriptional regulator [Liquorilactobacillus sucicola]KRN05667.1 hypothetical protein FD15_GL002231 [Liquorilactobacillus sucicola DSM 21376 = JCM 15457]GAJ25753.1 ferric uptake regulation protein Fur [Liquorilactobacillus sucicola DSM 21376 = JCM 15457]
MRLTKQRKAIIDLFKSNPGRAFSVEMIYNRIGNGKMNLSTVYRNVDRLTELGVLAKNLMESTAYYYAKKEKHQHFMICTSCFKMLPINHVIEEIIPIAIGKTEFEPLAHDIVIYGICRECQLKTKKSPTNASR